MVLELRRMGLNFRAEVPVPIVYRGEKIQEEGFRIDILVEDEVVVELKSVEEIKPVHKKQLLTYLKLTNKRIGLLINFNESLLRNGISRIVNDLKEDTCSDPAL
jgi:GxxExxY protein